MKSKSILIALFAALICAGCFIQIPLPSGVPIVLQDMFAMLTGILLGPLYGGISVLIFLLLGCFGLPVFTGKAGIQVIIAGPTGGFLIGYLVGAIVAGLFSALLLKKNNQSEIYKWIIFCLSAILATVIVFAFGIFNFMRVTNSNFIKACSLVLVPFIPGNIIKIILITILSKKFYPIVRNYL